MPANARPTARGAAEAVRGRPGGPCPLGLPLADAGSDRSALSQSRARLPAGGAVERLLTTPLGRGRERGWLRAGGQPRPDSARVPAAAEEQRNPVAVAQGDHARGEQAAALVGVAIAKTFTLQVAKNAKVTNTIGMTTRENIVVNSRSHAIYDLTGDSKNHPECTKAKGCFQFWPPVTASSQKQLSKAPGITGKLGTWHRNGFLQVTLAGHPLYRFAPDLQKNAATGEGIHSFGGTWHVVKASGSRGGSGGSSSGGGGGTTTSTTTTTTSPYPYPYP